jgi:pimeloyl-ACP methyl ester carboxylesterase
LKAGYSIHTYDRLGVGKSDKPDAYRIVQGPRAARAVEGDHHAGSFGLKIPDFEKIVLVGHSLGSILTLGVLSEYGGLVEGAVSTGLILNGKSGGVGQQAFGLEHAASNDRRRFRGRGSGYLIQATESNAQQIFKKGYFDPEMLAYGNQIKETGAVGEFVSLAAVLGRPVDML